MRLPTYGLGVIVLVAGVAIGACASDAETGTGSGEGGSGEGAGGPASGTGGAGASAGGPSSSSGMGNNGGTGNTGGGTGGEGAFCNDMEGAPCTAQPECCDPLKCLNDGTGLKCTAQCAGFNTPCSGMGQGNCCSKTLLCDATTQICVPAPCDSATVDCDGDGWMVSDGDCCDKPGVCGSEPEKVNPGAIEVEGNGLDDNCNGKTDLFDTEDTLPCDQALASNSANATDYAKAIGICKQTTENPAMLKDKTWGLIDAKILRVDGSALGDPRALSIRTSFGSVSPPVLDGSSVMAMSSGIAADATQTNPGPNGGAPGGFNVSTTHTPDSTVSLTGAAQYSVSDWYATANPPLKPANGLPDSPGCNGANDASANDSVMLVLRLRAPTNAKAFSFNSYFFSAEYPEFVCTTYNDQFIALVDTPSGTPSPIPNPVDKNLMTYSDGAQKWPIGINIAKGTNLFAVCDAQATNPTCWDTDVSATSCELGSSQLSGTGFDIASGDTCTIGGGTFWLTTSGNVVPGEIVEIRIGIWDSGDWSYDSLSLIDGFKWLANATLPGTG